MAIAIWRRGRRLFSTAAILMILTAAAHTAGNLASAPQSPAELKLFAEMSGFRVPLGIGMNPSMQDIYTVLVFTMSIAFVALGVINLLIAANPDTPGQLLRLVGFANLAWVTAFLILSWAYRVPPPLISAAVIDVAVIGSLLVAPGRRGHRV